ncbi:MAG: acyl-CoA dehydrogenase family protein [Gammaproteobacteria bacterium]|nr:acyl-CoA dehydrogenase family protein [Gammaproteobacteria bacterium]
MNRGLELLDRLRSQAIASAEESMLLDSLRSVIRNSVEPNAAEVDNASAFPDQAMAAINELGLNSVFLPEPYGFGDISFSCYLECVRLLSEACASTGITYATNFHAMSPIVDFSTPEQLARFAPVMAAGGLASLCITEPNAGSDAGSMALTMMPAGDEIELNGTKMFITNGDRSDILLLFGRWCEGGDDRGLTAVVVERPLDGLEVVGVERKLGHRGSPTATLAFDGCRVPRGNLLLGPGQGTAILRSSLNKSRPSVAAHALGIASAAIVDTVRYVNERRQFGKAIAEFQATQFTLADLATDLVMTEGWMRTIAARVEAGDEDIAVEASMLKLRASDLAMAAAVEAVQLHGGYGYTKDYRVERLFRDAKITQIWEGTNEIHRQMIGRRFIDK